MVSALEAVMPVKVSIVLPTYNQAHFLPQAIKTILQQTFANFELIIVNDGSTDETALLLSKLNNPKIRVVTQQNQGLPSALNAGFASAQGEYWTWTSTDNIVAPTWLEELANALDNSPADVAYAFSYYAGIDEQDRMLFVNRELRFDVPNLLMNHTGNASFLYRASLAKIVGPYDPNLMYAEDLDMWVRMAEHTRARLVPTVLYYYRLHEQSMTAQSEKVRRATQGLVNKYLAKYQGEFPIEKLFPSIASSTQPHLERWKARVWLSSLGIKALYYYPVDALVSQLKQALNEQYEENLIANIVHLYAKVGRWQEAHAVVAQYYLQDASPFLEKLATICKNQDSTTLLTIPYAMLDENLIAAEENKMFTQAQLLRNLASTRSQDNLIQQFIIDLLNQMEDEADHPEIWQQLASLNHANEQLLLNQIREMATLLLSVPQNVKATLFLRIVENVCYVYTGQYELGLNSLSQLSRYYPFLSLLQGAISYIQADVKLNAVISA